MNRFIRNLVLSTAVAAASLSPVASAVAEPWRAPHSRDRWDHRHHGDGGSRAGVAIGAGILGLAVGALIANSANPADVDGGRYDDRRDPDYFPGAPVRRPHVVRYGEDYEGGLQPWSRAWFRYCEDRYRTFDADTGTFRGTDGRDHFCVAS